MAIGSADLVDYYMMLERRVARLERTSGTGNNQGSTSYVGLLDITGLIVANQLVVSTFNEWVVYMTFSWNAVTLDSNIITDDPVAGYYTSWTRDGTNWIAESFTTDTEATIGPIQQGQSITFRVRTVTAKGTLGNYATLTVSSTTDNVAPSQPSTPTAVPYLGQARVFWNGLAVGGGAMAGDLNVVEIHMSTSGITFTPTPATLVDVFYPGGGYYTVTGLTYGTTYYFRLVAVDTVGNRSPSSTGVSMIPVQAADGDIASMSIGKLTVGTLAADMTVSARIKTANTGARTEMNSSGFQAYNSSNALTFSVSSSTGNVTSTGVFQTALAGQRIVIDSTGTYPTIWMNDNTGATAAFINSPGAGLGANSSTATNGSETTYTRTWWQPTTASMEMVLGATTTTLRGGQYSVGYTNAITSARDNSQVIRSQTEWNNGQSLRLSVYNGSAQESTKFNMSGTDSYWEFKTTGTQQYYGRFLLDTTGAHVTGWDAAGHQMAKLDAGSAEVLASSYNTSGSLLGKMSVGSLETYMEWKSGGVDPKCRLTLDNTNARMSGYNGSVVRSQVTANSSDARLDSYTSGGATNGTVNTGGAEIYMQWQAGTGSTITRITADGTNARLEGYNSGTLGSRITCTGNVTRMEHVSTGNGFEGSSTGPKIFGVVAPGGTPTAIGVDAGLVRFMSSSRRYKEEIGPASIDVEDWLKLRPVKYVFKADAEEGKSPHIHVGFIAEEVHDRKLGPSMVSYIDGKVESIYPLAVSAAQQAVLQQHHGRLAELERRLAAAGL